MRAFQLTPVNLYATNIYVGYRMPVEIKILKQYCKETFRNKKALENNHGDWDRILQNSHSTIRDSNEPK